MGSHVEGRVFHPHARGRDLCARQVRDLARCALLDGDAGTVGGFQIHGGEGRGNVHGNAVLAGEDGNGVGPDLVGRIAVGRDAVGADDHCLDLALGHDGAGHVVRDQRDRNVVLHQLPCREARALQEGAGFVGEDLNALAALDGGADDTERGAVAGRGQGSGVAVREHAAGVGHQRCAIGPHGAIGGNVFGVDGPRLVDECLLDDGNRAAADLLKAALHAANGPEEIHGGRTSFAHDPADLAQTVAEIGDAGDVQVTRAQGDAHGSGHADRRRAAHDHGADRVGDGFIGWAVHPGLFDRELGLIDEQNAGISPPESFKHSLLSASFGWN